MHDAQEGTPGAAPAEHGESHLPTYNRVIVLLAALTAVEFVIAFWMHGDIPALGTLPFVVGVLGLLLLAGWKAVWVARFFMHLKYDPSSLAFIAVIPVFLGTPIVLLVGYDLIKGPNF